jgi:hypothetical protein
MRRGWGFSWDDAGHRRLNATLCSMLKRILTLFGKLAAAAVLVTGILMATPLFDLLPLEIASLRTSVVHPGLHEAAARLGAEARRAALPFKSEQVFGDRGV